MNSVPTRTAATTPTTRTIVRGSRNDGEPIDTDKLSDPVNRWSYDKGNGFRPHRGHLTTVGHFALRSAFPLR